MIDSFRGRYYFLSNYFLAWVEYGGITYCNSEAAFQAQKTLDLARRQAFATFLPGEAKRAGRHLDLRPDWEDVKISVMRGVVRAKFDQNPDLAQKLLETGNEELVEGNTWGDRTWGVVDGEGENLLGQILMEERSRLSRDPRRAS